MKFELTRSVEVSEDLLDCLNHLFRGEISGIWTVELVKHPENLQRFIDLNVLGLLGYDSVSRTYHVNSDGCRVLKLAGKI